MRKRVTKLALMAFLVLLLAALPTLAACGDDEEEKMPAPEEKEVTLGMTVPLTGIAASSAGVSFNRFMNTLKYVNEVMGGIDGIKIKLVYADDKYDPATALMAIKRLRDRHHPMLWHFWTGGGMVGAKDVFERDKTPVLTVTANIPEMYVPPGMFFSYVYGSRSNVLTGVIEWILQDYDGPGRPKLGILYPDDATGRAHQLGNSYDWAEEHGVDIVARSMRRLALDLRPSLLALADEGVHYIFFTTFVQSDLVIAVRDARATGLWDRIKFVSSIVGENYDLIDLVGEDVDGLHFVATSAPWTDGLEANRRYAEMAAYPSQTVKPTDGSGAFVDILTALFRQAIADVGGYENLSGEAFYNAFQKLEDIDTGGSYSRLGWTPDRRVGVQTVKIIQVRKTEEGLQTFSVTDWIEMTNIFEGKEW